MNRTWNKSLRSLGDLPIWISDWISDNAQNHRTTLGAGITAQYNRADETENIGL